MHTHTHTNTCTYLSTTMSVGFWFLSESLSVALSFQLISTIEPKLNPPRSVWRVLGRVYRCQADGGCVYCTIYSFDLLCWWKYYGAAECHQLLISLNVVSFCFCMGRARTIEYMGRSTLMAILRITFCTRAKWIRLIRRISWPRMHFIPLAD